MSLSRFVGAFPADFYLTLVDVGSAGGTQPRWRRFAPLLSAVLFDPREPAASGQLGRGQTRIYPVALGAAAGEAMLHVTALANMSSVLEPNLPLMQTFRKKGAHAEVVERVKVPVTTLNALAAADRFAPDVLKIDTQGSELQIIDGARGVLADSVVLAEVEVSFLARYRDQPLFDDIVTTMRALGFELIELHRLKRYRAKNALGIANVGLGGGQRAGRVAYGDAIFLQSESALIARGGAALLKAILALVAYGKLDIAARLLESGRAQLDAQVASAMERGLKAIASSRLGVGRLHSAIDWLGRRV
ncbi:MAG: FkbM family methyltransferase [Steroidobacteraceae bacterium]